MKHLVSIFIIFCSFSAKADSLVCVLNGWRAETALESGGSASLKFTREGYIMESLANSRSIVSIKILNQQTGLEISTVNLESSQQMHLALYFKENNLENGGSCYISYN